MSDVEEKNQIAIYLLHENLDKTKEELVALNSKFPDLDIESEKRLADSMNAVKVSRSLNVEKQRLQEENIRLAAKLMQLRRHNEEQTQYSQTVSTAHTEMQNALEQKEHNMEYEIRKYEDSLSKKAESFRKQQVYYIEEHMLGEIETVTTMTIELEAKVCKQQSMVAELLRKLDDMQPNVPEDLLVILGEKELAEQLKTLTDKCEAMQEKRNELLNNRSNRYPSGNNKYKNLKG